MSTRLVIGATLAAAAVGLLAALAGVDAGAVVLMASGLVLTILAVGIALAAMARGRSRSRDAAPTIQPPAPAPARPTPSEHEGEPAKPGPALGLPGRRRASTSAPLEALHRIEPRGLAPADVLDALARASAAAGTVVAAHLWLFDDASDTMRLVAAIGTARPLPGPEPAAGSVLGQVARDGRAGLRQIGHPDHDRADRYLWRFALPVSAGVVRGTAAVDLETESPEREALIEVSSHLRGALSAALGTYVAINEAAAVEALLEASRRITRLVDEQAILETALERALALTGGRSGSIMVETQDQSFRIRVARGLPDEIVAQPIAPESAGIASLALQNNRAVMVDDLGERRARGRRHGVRSATVAPISDADGALGVLNVENDLTTAWRSSHRMRTLESLGTIVAIALRNAHALSTANELYLDTVKALAMALETKDPYCYGCTERIYGLSLQLGEELSLDDDELRALGFAALLHDIGMAAAGDLNSLAERQLTTVEQGLLKLHPVIAADVVERAPVLKAAVPIVYHHHERYDGGGYVLGLAGEQIPAGARVLAVADAFVAMTSERAYRPVRTASEALAEIEAGAGTQFDPRVVSALGALMQRNLVA